MWPVAELRPRPGDALLADGVGADGGESWAPPSAMGSASHSRPSASRPVAPGRSSCLRMVEAALLILPAYAPPHSLVRPFRRDQSYSAPRSVRASCRTGPGCPERVGRSLLGRHGRPASVHGRRSTAGRGIMAAGPMGLHIRLRSVSCITAGSCGNKASGANEEPLPCALTPLSARGSTSTGCDDSQENAEYQLKVLLVPQRACSPMCSSRGRPRSALHVGAARPACPGLPAPTRLRINRLGLGA